MSSPRTPRSSSRQGSAAPSEAGSTPSVRYSQQRSAEQEAMDTSDMSDLARPLPSSPAMPPPSGNPPSVRSGRGPPSVASSTSLVAPTPGQALGGMGPSGPGSVLVSEIDLSSPLNYGTPGSQGSNTVRTPGIRGTPI